MTINESSSISEQSRSSQTTVAKKVYTFTAPIFQFALFLHLSSLQAQLENFRPREDTNRCHKPLKISFRGSYIACANLFPDHCLKRQPESSLVLEGPIF